MSENISEMEMAPAVKTHEALVVSLRIIANQDAMLSMYRSRIKDLEVADKLLIDALTGITAAPPEENSGINKKETKWIEPA